MFFEISEVEAIDLSKVLPSLPYEVYGQPDVNKFYILAKLSASSSVASSSPHSSGV